MGCRGALHVQITGSPSAIVTCVSIVDVDIKKHNTEHGLKQPAINNKSTIHKLLVKYVVILLVW